MVDIHNSDENSGYVYWNTNMEPQNNLKSSNLEYFKGDAFNRNVQKDVIQQFLIQHVAAHINSNSSLWCVSLSYSKNSFWRSSFSFRSFVQSFQTFPRFCYCCCHVCSTFSQIIKTLKFPRISFYFEYSIISEFLPILILNPFNSKRFET